MVVDETRTAKVNDFNLAARVGLNQDIFWFQVAVNQLQIVDKAQCVQDLLSNSLEAPHIEVNRLFNFAVVLRILIQVVSQQLRDNKEVLFVVEVVNKLKQVFLVKILTISIDVTQKFNLVDTLIEVVLVVLDDLHAYHLLGMDVIALDRLGECR
jgi:hypothetical protein